MLKVENLSAGYGGMAILQGINIQAEKGEIVAVLGPNGSGKSTLLRAITGTLPAFGGAITAGMIRLGDKDIMGQKPHQLLCSGLAFVMDSGRMFWSLDVRDNILIGGYLLPGKKALQLALNEVCNRIPVVTDFLRRKPRQLSGGERQLVVLARGLMMSPEVIILDEPTAGLSPGNMELVLRVIRDLSSGGALVVMVEQNTKAALQFADRGYVLRRGMVFEEGDADELARSGSCFLLPEDEKEK